MQIQIRFTAAGGLGDNGKEGKKNIYYMKDKKKKVREGGEKI